MRDQFNREHDNRGRFMSNDDRGGRNSGNQRDRDDRGRFESGDYGDRQRGFGGNPRDRDDYGRFEGRDDQREPGLQEREDDDEAAHEVPTLSLEGPCG
jgi:hypothetical protein